MKIVHLLWGLSTGGIENMLVDIINEQIDGNDIALVVVNDMVDPNILKKLDSRIRVHFCKRQRKSRNPLPLLKLNYFLRKENPDLIHVHYDGLAKFVAGRWPKVRTIHNTTNSLEESKYFKACYAISKAVQEEWAQGGHNETILVENGLACDRINANRSNLFDDGKLHFVQVSRLFVEQKGQDILLKALAEIKTANLCEIDFKMHFIGDGSDKDLLQKMTAELGLNDVVVFEGNKPRDWVYEKLCNFDLFVQPSRYEGFGLTVAEAMVAKVPVLSSDIEGPLEIMTPKDNSAQLLGYTFQSENPLDLARKIADFVKNGRDDALINKACQHVLDNYHVKKTAARYLEEYVKVTGSCQSN